MHKTLQLRIRRSVMPYFLHWYLLLCSFGVVLSGNLTEEQRGEEIRKWLDDDPEFIKKYIEKEIVAYRGMSVNLFPNVSLDMDISVYANGKEDSQIIARLPIANGEQRWYKREYSSKIYIDKNMNIWFCNLDQNDARTYYLVRGVNMRGPDIRLTILEDPTEENHPEVCWSSHSNSTEKYFGKLTEVQIGEEIRKWLDDRPEYVKKYFANLAEVQIGEEIRKWLDHHPEYIKKYLEKVMPGQIMQFLCNHQREVLKEPIGSWNSLTTGLLLATCLLTILCIVLLYIVLTNKNNIKIRCISWRHRIHERPSSQNRRSKNFPQAQETVITIEDLGKLTEDQIWEQIQKWQAVYPGLFVKKFLETLKEDQVHKWLNDHPDFMDKYCDEHENDHQAAIPTLDELSVTLTESGTGIEGSQMQLVSTQRTFNVSQSSDEHENDHQAITPTLPEPSVALTESGNEIEGNQMSTQKKFIASQSSDEHENDHQAAIPSLDELSVTLTELGTGIEGRQMQLISTQKMFNASQSSDEDRNPVKTPTLNELNVTLLESGSGTEDNQRQLESSQEVFTPGTCSSPSSDTFSEPGPSGIQPFNMDERDANPEWNMAQAESEEFFGVSVKEDSNSEDECKKPFLEVHDD